MAQGRETRSFLIFIKEVLQAGCFDGQYIWFFPVTQLPVECLQHTIRGGSLSLSLGWPRSDLLAPYRKQNNLR